MESPLSEAQTAAARRRRELLARAEEHVLDVRLEKVRAWKEAEPGRRAVGHLPVWAPREILHAAGVLPVGVFGGGDRVEIVRGDAYFQSYICHLPRSVIEMGLSGALDPLDGMLFPSTCDVIRNLSGMWRTLFPEKLVRYIDVPQNRDPETGGRFFKAELRALARDLERIGGRRVDEEALRASIALYDRNRRLVRRLLELRAEKPWQVPASEAYLAIRMGYVVPVEEHNAFLEEFLRVAQEDERPPLDTARVVLRGSFCEQPPIDLVRTLERAGCSVVDDDWLLLARWHSRDVGTDGDPWEALVRAFLEDSPETATVHDAAGRKGEDLLERVRRVRAEGVVFAAPSFCDPALLDQPMLQRKVEEAGIPNTQFLYSENTGQYQVIREQAGTFADAIRLS